MKNGLRLCMMLSLLSTIAIAQADTFNQLTHKVNSLYSEAQNDRIFFQMCAAGQNCPSQCATALKNNPNFAAFIAQKCAAQTSMSVNTCMMFINSPTFQPTVCQQSCQVQICQTVGNCANMPNRQCTVDLSDMLNQFGSKIPNIINGICPNPQDCLDQLKREGNKIIHGFDHIDPF